MARALVGQRLAVWMSVGRAAGADDSGWAAVALGPAAAAGRSTQPPPSASASVAWASSWRACRSSAWACWATRDQKTLDIPKHAELAWRLNTTRESITRTFQRLLSEGVLQREGEDWVISDFQALMQLAMGDAREDD